MDREPGDDAVWAKPHIDAPFCALHASMCCTEYLMGVLQRKVVEEGGASGVLCFNKAMAKVRIGLRIRRRVDKVEDSVRTGGDQWKKVKLNGNTAIPCRSSN